MFAQLIKVLLKVLLNAVYFKIIVSICQEQHLTYLLNSLFYYFIKLIIIIIKLF